MDTTTLDHMNKVIEQYQLSRKSLLAILGKNIDHGRSAGILLTYDS